MLKHRHDGGGIRDPTAPIVGQRSDTPRSRASFLTPEHRGARGLHCAGLLRLAGALLPVLGVVLVAVVAWPGVRDPLGTTRRSRPVPCAWAKVSGWAGARGTWAGIFALAFVLFGFVTPGFLGIPTEDALNYRPWRRSSAAWILVFLLPRSSRGAHAVPRIRRRSARPVPRRDPHARRSRRAPRRPLAPSRAAPARDRGRPTGSSSPRSPGSGGSRGAPCLGSPPPSTGNGLAGVFTFGGVLAAGPRLLATEVIVFAVAANLIAVLGAFVGGSLDDALGPAGSSSVRSWGSWRPGSRCSFLARKPAFLACGRTVPVRGTGPGGVAHGTWGGSSPGARRGD
ncbi:hypothetical protein QJS66_17880 [Kocuria rhizophila]|nr:hypothetical protein QJS66_17880 [Kocuria rhizophila]